MRLAPACGLAAIPLLLFWKAVFKGEVLYQRDIHLIWFGQIETFVRAVTSGSWPVWDPYTGFGQPLLANPDAQVLYPPTWLNFVMRPGAYYTLYVVSHLVFSGLGLHLLARRLGCSRGGAFVGASVWIASGPLLSTVDVWHHFGSACWGPWVFLAADRAVASSRLRDAILCGAAIATQLLAGSADMTVLFGLALIPFVLASAKHHGTGASWRRLATLGGAAAMAALALSAALWLPTLDAARRSARSALPSDVRTNWSVHPVDLASVLMPIPFGWLPLHPRWREALFDSRGPFLASLYLGAVTLALVVPGLIGRPRRPVRIVLAGCVLGALLFALGKHAVFYGLAERLVPPLRMLRYPSKAMLVAAFAWALLAALGYDQWRRPMEGRRGRWLVAAAGPVLLLAVIAGYGAWRIRHDAAHVGAEWLDPQIPSSAFAEVLAPSVRSLARCAALCAAAGVLASARVAGRSSSWPALALAGMVIGDLVSAHMSLNPTAPARVLAYRPPTLQWIEPQEARRLYVYDYYGVRGSERYLPSAPLPETLQKLKEAWPYPFGEVIEFRNYLMPPLGVLFRLSGSYEMDMRGLQPLPQARLAIFLRATEGTPAHVRLLRMGVVSRVVARHREGFEDLVLLSTLQNLTGPFYVYGVPDPLPRAYAVSGARIADGQAAFDALVHPSFDPAREVILPEGSPAAVAPSFSGTARVTTLEADRVRVEADLSEAGYVVLVDAYDPGWRTTVDGRATPLLRANIAFRAVAVAAGRHVIESVYRPRAVLAGLAVSAAALVAGLGAALRGGFHAQRAR